MNDIIPVLISITIAKELLRQGLILPEEYQAFITKMKSKTDNSLFDLFSDIDLINT